MRILLTVKKFFKTSAPGMAVWISKQKEKKYDFSVSYQFNHKC